MTTIETAQAFIARKQAQFQKELEKHTSVKMKDIGRKGKHTFIREAWTFHVQHNLPEKVIVIERLRKAGIEGDVVHKKTQKAGEIEYRVGYFIVGKIGRAKGHWMWGQFCPVIPAKDFEALLEKAEREKTIL